MTTHLRTVTNIIDLYSDNSVDHYYSVVYLYYYIAHSTNRKKNTITGIPSIQQSCISYSQFQWNLKFHKIIRLLILCTHCFIKFTDSSLKLSVSNLSYFILFCSWFPWLQSRCVGDCHNCVISICIRISDCVHPTAHICLQKDSSLWCVTESIQAQSMNFVI